MSLYWKDITQRGESKSYDKFVLILTLHLYKKRLKRTKAVLDRGWQRLTPAASSLKGVCNQWAEKGKCSRGENRPWVESHTPERAKSKPPRGRSPSEIEGGGADTNRRGRPSSPRGGGPPKEVLPPVAGKTAYPAMPTLKALSRPKEGVQLLAPSCVHPLARGQMQPGQALRHSPS